MQHVNPDEDEWDDCMQSNVLGFAEESSGESSEEEQGGDARLIGHEKNGPVKTDRRNRRRAVFPMGAAVALDPPEAESNDELEDVDMHSGPDDDAEEDSEGVNGVQFSINP